MNQYLGLVALVVADYDEAIRFYTECLGFVLEQDTPLSPDKRWVVVRPPGDGLCGVLLARATNETQAAAVGNQSGGRVFLFLHTDDLAREHARLCARGVRIVREPSREPYGKVLVFADLYGNLWDLIEPAAP